MALLPSFPSANTIGPQGVRARLVGLRGAPGPPVDPGDPGPGAVVDAVSDASYPSAPQGDDPLPSTSRGGRLVQRWVPAPLRDARWEPGRPGALLLSLVAALAAVVAAVGVWRERPVPEPAPALPLVTAAAARAPSAPPPAETHEVVISVVGRVARPGLIRLPDGTRVADALAAVGGALPGTDLMGLTSPGGCPTENSCSSVWRHRRGSRLPAVHQVPPAGPGRSISTRRLLSSLTGYPALALSPPSGSWTGVLRTVASRRWISSVR